MDYVHRATAPGPAIVRAQVILQNYICFVYLGEMVQDREGATARGKYRPQVLCFPHRESRQSVSKRYSPRKLEVQRRL